MTNTQSLYNFIFGNSTHVGRVRSENEDYYGSFDTPNGYIFLVCDGMGGHAGGAKASQIAVDTIKTVLQSQSFSNREQALSFALTAANKSILDYAKQHPGLKGMGSTCVAVLIKESDVSYAHVGDSRIYHFTGNQLHQITKDHSFVQMLVDAGEISKKEAETHPRKNEITNALGLPEMNPPTVSLNPVKAVKGDIILLCSDGLTGMVSDEEIQQVLKSPANIQDKAEKLVEIANNNGGKDNVTVQLIEFQRSDYKESSNYPHQKNKRINLFLFIGLLILALIGSGTYLWFWKNRTQKNTNKPKIEQNNVLPKENPGIKKNDSLKSIHTGLIRENTGKDSSKVRKNNK